MMRVDRHTFVAEAAEAYARNVRPINAGSANLQLGAFSMGVGSPVVLLHGWPMTSYCWRYVQPALAGSHRQVVAIDLPGLGSSSRSSHGYDTVSVAQVILDALDSLNIGSFALIGHDVGGMVSVSLALLAPERMTSLCLIETEAPGFAGWEETLRNPRLWHFHFHQTPGLPETLILGHEHDYIRFFYQRDAVVADTLDEPALNIYAAAQSDPAQLKAGLEYYRAFDRSAERNRELAARGPLPMPIFAVDGKFSRGDEGASWLTHVATSVEHRVIECGHFIPEEAPEILAPDLITFLDRHSPRGR